MDKVTQQENERKMVSEEKPPFPGMKEIPFGLPLMLEAWQGCVSWAMTVPEMLEQFKQDTGIDLARLAASSPLDKMIDQATGFQDATMAAWCDWVTVNVWGDGRSEPGEQEVVEVVETKTDDPGTVTGKLIDAQTPAAPLSRYRKFGTRVVTVEQSSSDFGEKTIVEMIASSRPRNPNLEKIKVTHAFIEEDGTLTPRQPGEGLTPEQGLVEAKADYPELECPLCGIKRKPWSLNKDGSVTYSCPADHVHHGNRYTWRITVTGELID